MAMALGKGRRLVIIGLTVAVVVLLDQASKYAALYLLQDRGIISLFDDTLRFLLVENRGGFLSLGASLSEGARSFIFLLLTSLFLLLFLVYTLVDRHATPGIVAASAMIIGGGIGNLIDRILRDGAVIDFANVGIGRLRTGIFNVADMAVLFGCIVLLLSLLRAREKKTGT